MYSFRTLAALSFLILVVAIGISYAEFSNPSHSGAVLQGAVSIQSVQPVDNIEGKIQPGTPVKINVVVENIGQKTSDSGQLAVRFSFPEPLDVQPKSQIFQTEKVEVPSLAPGQKTTLTFTKTQQLPSILDFVREDWSMREYQAILTMKDKNYIIGVLPIAISAYYYPGMMKEMPTRVLNVD